MEKELVELYDAAKRAADAAASLDGDDAEESRCIDALKELKNFPVNYKILVDTQVGKNLRRLTKHPRKKIQTFAADLIAAWKKVIIEETDRKNGTSENKPNTNGEGKKRPSVPKLEKDPEPEIPKTAKVEQDPSPKPAKIPKVDTVNTESTIPTSLLKGDTAPKLENQLSNTRKSFSVYNGPTKLTSMIKCNDDVRDNIRKLIWEGLCKVYDEADETLREDVEASDPIRVAVSVESAIFEKWGHSTGPYKAKYRSIIFNLKDQKNPDFRRRVLLGHVEPESIPLLSTDEMASDKRKRENQHIKEKAMFDCERAGAPKATTDQFKCGRCGNRNCTYYQLQTRSADEPMTTFVTCVTCNNHWKFC